ncbi:MAG: MFS transporter [Chloroflexota bacterium]
MTKGRRKGISLSNQRTFASLKNRSYRLYYGGLIGEMAPMTMQMLTQSLLAYRLTGSAAILGIVSFAHAIPMLVFSLFGGAIADRVQKKYVLVAGHVVASAIALGTALTLTLGYLSAERAGSWWILVVASALHGTIMGFEMPSRQAIVREIVSVEQLMNAVALNTLAMNTLRLIAPAAAGFLVDAFDFAFVYYVMGIIYLTTTIFVALLPRTSLTTTHGSSHLTDIKVGLQYIRHKPIILVVLLFTLFVVILSMPYSTLIPIFTEDILKVGAKGLGVLLSVSGIGAAAGSIVLASLPNKKRGLILIASSFILGLALIGFSFSSSWYASLILIAFVGLGQTGRMVLSNAMLQYYVEDEYRGRVMSILLMEFGLTSFGTFGAALLTEVIGVQWAVGGFAMVLVLLCILALTFSPRLRQLD